MGPRIRNGGDAVSLPLSVPLFVGCVASEANMLVFGPFFDPLLAEQEAEGADRDYAPCQNAHLIGHTVGPHTHVVAPSIPKAALVGEHGAAVDAWHLERSKQTPPYRLVHATEETE